MKVSRTSKTVAVLFCLSLLVAACKSEDKSYGGGESPKEPPAPKQQPKPAPAK